MRRRVFLILQREFKEEQNAQNQERSLIKHTSDSAAGAAFYLKGDYSERSFQYLYTDAKNRNAKIFHNVKKVRG